VRSRALAGGFAGRGRRRLLCDNLAGDGGVLLKECAQLFVDYGLHYAGDVGIQLAFGLTFELRLRQLDADHGHQAFADIVSSEFSSRL